MGPRLRIVHGGPHDSRVLARRSMQLPALRPSVYAASPVELNAAIDTSAAMKPRGTHTEPPPSPALRIQALELLLIEKGLIDPGAIDEIVELFEHRVGSRNGARVVARAWTDPRYTQRLLADAAPAIAKLGITGHHSA